MENLLRPVPQAMRTTYIGQFIIENSFLLKNSNVWLGKSFWLLKSKQFSDYQHFVPDCLMYLYHYPDVWYDYATWHAKNGSVDSAIKIFQRASKALPDSELLKYAYAELEESRGAIQAAKKIYENILASSTSGNSLAQIQFIRFLRRTEGIEAARKYFLDARKLPNCTYHVYVAYATMAFCLDKDAKVAHNVFEAGLKKFMNEPGYILENVRALFERALSLLSPEESEEVWKQFIKFEQTYGDLASMLKVEQRRKEAFSRACEEEASALDSSLHDVVSRYSFMDLWPCSSKDLDHLARQEWLSKNINKKVDKSAPSSAAISTVLMRQNHSGAEKGSVGLLSDLNSTTPSAKLVYPDTSRMLIYDPRQKQGTGLVPGNSGTEVPTTATAINSNSSISLAGGGPTKPLNEILKVIPAMLVGFISNLPPVEGPSPDVDIVLSVLLQSNIPSVSTGKPAASSQQVTGTGPATSDLSGSSKTRPNPSGSSVRHSKKRQQLDKQEDDETTTIQSRPLPRDVFKLREIQRIRRGGASQTGSVSNGSAFSGELSGSTG
ncbi:hypothetical protein QJS04_geneDACA003537 [Acorus gramineus]|uniref:Suppressor of forked domain-containing protein n=1 Tax=Acorus gramineus TaxID=55184 RepID=A0AAV9BRM3_ACOGR|nr:hypothetical protein QJS04_geneDACA003537 [Acorus gramineus]